MRAHTLVEEYDFVSREDPALDTDASDFEERWQQYRDGAADCPLRAGLKPVLFRLRHLRTSDQIRLAALDGANMLAYAFRLAVVGITEPTGPMRLEREDRDGVRLLTEAMVDAWTPAVIVEVGSHIVTRARPTPK